jgi:hypothetical protein
MDPSVLDGCSRPGEVFEFPKLNLRGRMPTMRPDFNSPLRAIALRAQPIGSSASRTRGTPLHHVAVMDRAGADLSLFPSLASPSNNSAFDLPIVLFRKLVNVHLLVKRNRPRSNPGRGRLLQSLATLESMVALGNSEAL